MADVRIYRREYTANWAQWIAVGYLLDRHRGTKGAAEVLPGDRNGAVSFGSQPIEELCGTVCLPTYVGIDPSWPVQNDRLESRSHSRGTFFKGW